MIASRGLNALLACGGRDAMATLRTCPILRQTSPISRGIGCRSRRLAALRPGGVEVAGARGRRGTWSVRGEFAVAAQKERSTKGHGRRAVSRSPLTLFDRGGAARPAALAVLRKSRASAAALARVPRCPCATQPHVAARARVENARRGPAPPAARASLPLTSTNSCSSGPFELLCPKDGSPRGV